MGSTTHRKDISGADFTRLAKFSHSLSVLEGPNERLPWNLKEVSMLLPVWSLSKSYWRLANYKEFKREALGITVPDFRRTCRYIKVTEPQMIDTLFRMSMISVVKEQRLYERPKFKMPFRGLPISFDEWSHNELEAFGFVIERRRADGAFKQGEL